MSSVMADSGDKNEKPWSFSPNSVTYQTCGLPKYAATIAPHGSAMVWVQTTSGSSLRMTGIALRWNDLIEFSTICLGDTLALNQLSFGPHHWLYSARMHAAPAFASAATNGP